MLIRCSTQEESVWRFSMDPCARGEVVVTREGVLHLLELLTLAEQDSRCRVVVIEGSGDCFCLGMDLAGLVATDSTVEAEQGVALFAELLSRMRRSPKVIISMVDGAALAGGIGLVAVSDFAIATSRSKFALPEAMLGLVPAMVLPFLMERMPPQKARRLALNPLSFGPAEALAQGLVDVVVPDAEAAEAKLYSELKNLLRLSPSATAEVRRFTLEISEGGAISGLEKGRELTACSLQNKETTDAVRDFLSGLPLPWFARPKGRKSSCAQGVKAMPRKVG